MQRLGDQLLAYLRAVGLGRIDQIDAELDGAAEHGQRLFAIARRSEDAVAGDPHRAEAEAVDREIAADGERAASRGRNNLSHVKAPLRLTVQCRCRSYDSEHGRAERARYTRFVQSSSSPIEIISRECFRSFTELPNATLLDGDGVFGVITDAPITFFSGIASTDAPDAGAIIERFRARQSPFRWWITPETNPPDLPSVLPEHGMRFAWDAQAMVADLATVNFDVPLPEGVAIERVSDRRGMEEWAAIMPAGFSRPPEEAAIWLDAYNVLGFDRSWAHFVAYLDGTPAATTSLLLCDGGVAGVYHVVTLKEARGRGIGSAVTLAAMRHARDRGATVAALQASEMGYSVYRSIGFVDVATVTIYDWRPGY